MEYTDSLPIQEKVCSMYSQSLTITTMRSTDYIQANHMMGALMRSGSTRLCMLSNTRSWVEVKARMVLWLRIVHVLFMIAMHKHAGLHTRLHFYSHVLGSRAYLTHLSPMKGWNGDKRMKCEWHSHVLSSAHTHTHTESCLVLNTVLQSGPLVGICHLSPSPHYLTTASQAHL